MVISPALGISIEASSPPASSRRYALLSMTLTAYDVMVSIEVELGSPWENFLFNLSCMTRRISPVRQMKGVLPLFPASRGVRTTISTSLSWLEVLLLEVRSRAAAVDDATAAALGAGTGAEAGIDTGGPRRGRKGPVINQVPSRFSQAFLPNEGFFV